MKKIVKMIVAFILATTIIISGANASEAATGTWKNDGNGWWYSYSDGSYPKGAWAKIGSSWYYFDTDGYMEASAYRDGCWLNSDGTWNTKYTGGYWASNSTGWWYTDKSGWYPVSQWLQIDGKVYYFKDSGYMATDEWIGDYYVDASGAWQKDKVKIDGPWKEAYRSVVEEYAANNKETEYGKIRYGLIYIDNDDTPELVCTKQGYYVAVYTYYDGNAKCIMDNWGYGAGGNVGYTYGEKTGIVANSNSDMAGSLRYLTYWKLENGELKNTDYYLCVAMFDYKKYGANWSHAEDGDYHYYKIASDSNGKRSDYEEITKDEYNSLTISASEYITGGQTKEEILSDLK